MINVEEKVKYKRTKRHPIDKDSMWNIICSKPTTKTCINDESTSTLVF